MRVFISLILLTVIFSCGEEKSGNNKVSFTKHQVDSMVEDLEKKYNRMEEDRIRDYISRHEPMRKTSSGFWYVINSKNEQGREIKDGDLVKYSREISLCNSQQLYNDENILKIGQGHEISGMHAALKLLRQGEKATFIFPSFLAHGLLGDMEKVPPKSELIYKVEILDVK